MYVSSIRPAYRAKTKSVVTLSEGWSFTLYNKEIRRYHIIEDDEISPETYELILTEVFYPRAKKRAMHLLQKMDRTRADITKKLKDSGYPDEAIEHALSYLDGFHYIDDRRYAESYIRSYKDTRSMTKIRQALSLKGISSDLIEECLDSEYDTSEEDLIIKLIEKKHYDKESASEKDKAKMYRFLMSRGFKFADIAKLC